VVAVRRVRAVARLSRLAAAANPAAIRNARSKPPTVALTWARRAADARDGRVSVLELSPGGQEIVHGFEAGLAARLGHLIADWPERKRQAAASTLADLTDAIQRDLAEEDGAAGQSADRHATAVRA
jgi:hypothetical protein